MSEYNVGVNIGGIIGGKKNKIINRSAAQTEQMEQVTNLLFEIRSIVDNAAIQQEHKEEAEEYINAIEEETAQAKPRKSILTTALAGLQKIINDQNFLDLVKKLTSIIGTLAK